MAHVYILKSLVNDGFYIGSTNDINRRLGEHNRGHTKYTRFLKPFEVVLLQEYSILTEARKIEHKLKKLKSRKILEKIVKEKIIKMSL